MGLGAAVPVLINHLISNGHVDEQGTQVGSQPEMGGMLQSRHKQNSLMSEAGVLHLGHPHQYCLMAVLVRPYRLDGDIVRHADGLIYKRRPAEVKRA